MDYKLFRALHALVGRYYILDKFMIHVSKKVPYVYFFLFLIILFRNHPLKKAALLALKSSLFTLLINNIIRLFLFKPRPFVKHRVRILMPAKEDSSFPSKHTLLAFAVSTSFFLQKRVLGSIMLLLSTLTGLSRVWVGHHYPSDIVGSAFIGSLASFFINKDNKRKTSSYFLLKNRLRERCKQLGK